MLISNLVQSRINAPVAPAGSGWVSHPLNGLSNFFLVNTSLAPGVIASTEGEVSQVRGYHATVTYNLGRNIILGDTGLLTITVTQGDLGVDAVVVEDGTDFTCDAAIDQCVYDFDADGDGADDVGRDSLNLVLSLAIGGADNLEMTLTTANVGNPFSFANAAVTVIRANYTVSTPAADQVGDISEGGPPENFDVIIDPTPAVGLTVPWRLTRDSGLAIAHDPEDLIVRDSAGVVQNCEVETGGTFIGDLICDLIVAAQEVDVSLAPSGVFQPTFSIAAVSDDIIEGDADVSFVGLQGGVGLISGPVAVDDDFSIIDVDPPLANFASAASEVEENGGRALIPLSLTPNGNALGGVPITVQWTFTDAASAFEVVCFSGGVEIDNPVSERTCESVVEAGSSSADITVNSGDSAAAGAEVLELDIIDSDGYDLGATVNHLVNIVRPPDANFVAGTSEVQAEGGEVVIVLGLSESVAVGAEPVTILWSFADGAAFGTNAECVDSSGNVITNADVLADAASGNCRSVVPANGTDTTAEITITANDDSTATDANLILTIGDGEGYSIGTQVQHEVDLTPPPVVSFAEAGPTYVAHGDSTNGNEVRILVNLLPLVPAGETLDVQWSWPTGLAAVASVCDSPVDVLTTRTCTTEVQEDAKFL